MSRHPAGSVNESPVWRPGWGVDDGPHKRSPDRHPRRPGSLDPWRLPHPAVPRPVPPGFCVSFVSFGPIADGQLAVERQAARPALQNQEMGAGATAGGTARMSFAEEEGGSVSNPPASFPIKTAGSGLAEVPG
jgi:hypothetical protein